MKCIGINKQTLYYALFKEKSEIVDSYGYPTGEYEEKYYDPVAVRMNVSPANGHARLKEFGIMEDYTHVACTDDMNCPISEDSIIWYGVSTSEPYNYRVAWISRSLNSISYGLKKVTVS